jgi:glycosyltransferase involved in cell wall biosynthesis
MIEPMAASAEGFPSGFHDRTTLSVVLPNYNHGNLIGRAVKALLAQERVPDEIIIIDDGSTDESVAIIRSLMAGSAVIRLIARETNEGAMAALSRGLAECRGQYVYFAAADDWVLPGFFSAALAVLERHPTVGLVCGESRLVSGRTGGPLGVRPIVRPSNAVTLFSPAETAQLLKRADNWILTGSTIFDRARVLAAGGFQSELGSFADGYLARKVALTDGFCFIPRLMATWQVFDDSFSRETAADPIAIERVRSHALARFAQDVTFPRWYGELFSRRLQFGMARLAVSNQPMNRAVLTQATANSRLGRFLVDTASRVPASHVLRATLLGWLWLQFWPMSPLLVLRTAVWRHFTRASA